MTRRGINTTGKAAMANSGGRVNIKVIISTVTFKVMQFLVLSASHVKPDSIRISHIPLPRLILNPIEQPYEIIDNTRLKRVYWISPSVFVYDSLKNWSTILYIQRTIAKSLAVMKAGCNMAIILRPLMIRMYPTKSGIISNLFILKFRKMKSNPRTIFLNPLYIVSTP
jgi:hypothetical protein